MKKMLKKMLIGALIMTMVTSLVGCNYTKKKQERIDKRKCELTLKLLEEKYGEKFELDRYYYDGGFNAVCHPVEHPEIFFDVYVPHEEISSDSYAKEILVRTLQKECNKVLDELGIEYYCRPVIFDYELDVSTGKFNVNNDKEYVLNHYNIDLVKDIKESEVMIEVYISMDKEYDIKELYNTIYKIINVINVNSGSVAYIFTNTSDIHYIKQQYDNSILHKSNAIVSTFYDAFAGITDFNTISTKYEEFEQRFKEYQSKAQEANK